MNDVTTVFICCHHFMGTLEKQTNRQLVLPITLNHYRFLIMPLHININHWVSLIADVRNKIVGIVNSMLLSRNGRFHSTNHFIQKFIVFMTEWNWPLNLTLYGQKPIILPIDSKMAVAAVFCSLMNAEALVNDISIDDIDTSCAKLYRLYISERLVLYSRVYNTNTDKACEMLHCTEPKDAEIQ